MSGKSDPNRISRTESRLCVAKVVDAVQNAGYHGDVTLRFRNGELFNVICNQTALPRDILDERFLCVLLRQRHVNDKDQPPSAEETRPGSR